MTMSTFWPSMMSPLEVLTIFSATTRAHSREDSRTLQAFSHWRILALAAMLLASEPTTERTS